MTNKKRFLMALTVVSFLTVTGFVIGCDSDDGPKVTAPAPAPSGGGENGDGENGDGNGENGDGNGGPTESRESLEGGQRCSSSSNGEIRNQCNTALNVAFRCSETGQWTHHFRIGPGGRMTRSPINCGGRGAWNAACLDPGVAQSSGDMHQFRCYINTGIVPSVYTGTQSQPGPSPAPTSTYGSIAFSHRSGGGYTWRMDFGSTESEARSKTLASCRSNGGTNCQSREFGRGQCLALAVGTRDTPAWAMGRASTKLAAQNQAIARCRSLGGQNCRIDSGTNGVASRCL